MSMVWVPLKVIGPVRPGVVAPAAMFSVIVASIVPVECVLATRRALASIHDVTTDVVVPFIERLCKPLAPPVDGNRGVPPCPAIADMSSVRSMVVAMFDSTTDVLTFFTCSSRRYLFLVVTWIDPLPIGLAWSYSFVHVSPGLTALSGRIAVIRPPSVPESPGREPLVNVLPFTLTIRPSDATFISTLVGVVVVVVLVVPLVVVLTERSVREIVRSAVPLESTDFTVIVSLPVMSRLNGTENPSAPIV